jgi:hypothetical protein
MSTKKERNAFVKLFEDTLNWAKLRAMMKISLVRPLSHREFIEVKDLATKLEVYY